METFYDEYVLLHEPACRWTSDEWIEISGDAIVYPGPFFIKRNLNLDGALPSLQRLSGNPLARQELEEGILKMARKLQGPYFSLVEFQKIFRNLPLENLEALAYFLETQYSIKVKLGCKIGGKFSSGGQKVVNGGGFVMNAATQAITGLFAKVAVDKAVSAFETSSACSFPWAKPCGDAAAVGGFLLIMAGLILQEKKPGFSKTMVKFGAVAIAFAILLPMVLSLSLPPLIACLFGLLAATIVGVTAALA